MSDVSTTWRPKILVVDDHPAIHEDYRKILCPDDDASDIESAEQAFFGDHQQLQPQPTYELDSALQGEQALEKVQTAMQNEQPYSMAFVDMRMPPGWNGVETIKRLWQADPDLQVVICSAYSDYAWPSIVQRLGHNDQLLILKKPFDSMEVSQLALALTTKRQLEKQASLKTSQLQQLVDEQTRGLQCEIEERKRVHAALVAARDTLQHQATHDWITGVWNRGAISEILEKNLSRCQREQAPLTLAFADIDHFKRVNDEHGHLVGDKILRGVADTMRATLRNYDEIGRYGGEEFLIVLPDCNLIEAEKVAERVRKDVEAHRFPMSAKEISVTVSLGLATASWSHDCTVEGLTQQADAALYLAKERGRNRVVCCSRSAVLDTT